MKLGTVSFILYSSDIVPTVIWELRRWNDKRSGEIFPRRRLSDALSRAFFSAWLPVVYAALSLERGMFRSMTCCSITFRKSRIPGSPGRSPLRFVRFCSWSSVLRSQSAMTSRLRRFASGHAVDIEDRVEAHKGLR
jgi:hypothetical protein